MIKMDKVTEDS